MIADAAGTPAALCPKVFRDPQELIDRWSYLVLPSGMVKTRTEAQLSSAILKRGRIR